MTLLLIGSDAVVTSKVTSSFLLLVSLPNGQMELKTTGDMGCDNTMMPRSSDRSDRLSNRRNRLNIRRLKGVRDACLAMLMCTKGFQHLYKDAVGCRFFKPLAWGLLGCL